MERFADARALTNQFNQRSVSNSARLVLDQAARAGLDPARVHFRVKNVFAKATGAYQNPQSSTKGDLLPTSFGIRITLEGEPVKDDAAGRALRGEYELALGGSFEFPDGWRTYEGIRWNRFPEGLPDERTKREVLLVSNIVARVGEPLQAADDPGLRELGHTLVRFLQQHDEQAFESEALLSFEQCWERLTRTLTGSGADEQPPRKEVQDAWSIQRGVLVESARAVLAQAELLGIDFSGAEITLKDAIAVNPYMRGGYGAVDGIDAAPLQFILGVRSNKKSKAGHPIAGDYTLTALRGLRGPARWTIEDRVRWEKFPDGLLGEKETTTLAFENYVAEHDVLPPGTTVPDIEFVRLDNETKGKLSDFRGKVVLLEWWSTSCGPCQRPLAELQALAAHRSEWKDKVEIITVSIDDDLRQANEHLAKRGWTNCINVWAGPGGWMSAPAKAFRLHALPTCYMIGPKGKVAHAGFPWSISPEDLRQFAR